MAGEDTGRHGDAGHLFDILHTSVMATRPMNIIRISVIEDDERERSLLTNLLSRSSGFDVVGSHARPESAWNLLRAERPNMILLDLVFPNGALSGHEFLLRLRGEPRAPRVVAWTAYADEGRFFSALKAGVCGYLLKTTPLGELPGALHNMNHGELRISAGVARLMLREFQQPKTPPTTTTAHALSGREETTLQLIASGSSQDEVAAKLGISLRTVEHHLAEVRRKLAARTTAQAVAKFARCRP